MKISVLINNYNNGPWLRQCVDSALTQTRPADEVIVYDDGSTDDSIALLRTYGDRIRLILGKHDDRLSPIQCAAAAVAKAFAASAGDFVCLLDGDDFYAPDHLEKVLAAWAESPRAVMVQSPLRVVNVAGEFIRMDIKLQPKDGDYLKAIYSTHTLEWFYSTSALAFRADFLRALLPVAIPAGSTGALDMRLSFMAALDGNGVVTLPQATVLYRKRKGSMGQVVGYSSLSARQRSKIQVTCFNEYARGAGKPALRYWRNWSMLLQLLREKTPPAVGDYFARRKLAWYRARIAARNGQPAFRR